MNQWRPPDPAIHTERHYRRDNLKASTADLLEQLSTVRSERDAARKETRREKQRRESAQQETDRLRHALERLERHCEGLAQQCELRQQLYEAALQRLSRRRPRALNNQQLSLWP